MLLVDRSIDACLAAIEVYNKTDFRYREEAFSILMVNARELLPMAPVLKENRNKQRSIKVREPDLKKDGSKGNRLRPKLNRSKNRLIIDIVRAMGLVQSYATDDIDGACVKNLKFLMEIRDNCLHLAEVRPGLGKRIQEVGSASFWNFVHAVQWWFTVNLGRFNFYLMPLAFQSPAEAVADLMRVQPAAARNLLAHIAEAEAEHPPSDEREFSVTMGIEVQFLRSQDPDALPVSVGKSGFEIRLSETDVRARWPWRYETLTRNLRARYSDSWLTRSTTRLESFWKTTSASATCAASALAVASLVGGAVFVLLLPWGADSTHAGRAPGQGRDTPVGRGRDRKTAWNLVAGARF